MAESNDFTTPARGSGPRRSNASPEATNVSDGASSPAEAPSSSSTSSVDSGSHDSAWVPSVAQTEQAGSSGKTDQVSPSSSNNGLTDKFFKARPSGKKQPPPRKKRSFWVELPILVLVAVLVAVLVRSFVVQTFYIPSESMENTLVPDDRVLVNKMIYNFRDPHRGEVVVFKPPSSWRVGPNKDDYIKRVIAVGGDRVICCDSQERITINGKPLKENYLYPGDKPSAMPFDVKVPRGRLFVLGDHRSASADSRVHLESSYGTIPLSSVVGRAFAIFWPVNHFATLPVPRAFEAIPGPSD